MYFCMYSKIQYSVKSSSGQKCGNKNTDVLLIAPKEFLGSEFHFHSFFKYVNLMDICQLTDQSVLDSRGQRLGIVRCTSL